MKKNYDINNDKVASSLCVGASVPVIADMFLYRDIWEYVLGVGGGIAMCSIPILILPVYVLLKKIGQLKIYWLVPYCGVLPMLAFVIMDRFSGYLWLHYLWHLLTGTAGALIFWMMAVGWRIEPKKLTSG